MHVCVPLITSCYNEVQLCSGCNLHRITPTNDAFSKRGTFKRGQPQVSDLDGAGGAGDEDVVTLEVPVDDGRSARVQEVKPFEDLTTPALQQFQLHLFEPLQVTTRKRIRFHNIKGKLLTAKTKIKKTKNESLLFNPHLL